uniref:Uncharacterized protein n=1 Tax=Aegilops tauschii subsp. strangulata TaxID=200361 RepID=A0A453EAQ6_AEGTS
PERRVRVHRVYARAGARRGESTGSAPAPGSSTPHRPRLPRRWAAQPRLKTPAPPAPHRTAEFSASPASLPPRERERQRDRPDWAMAAAPFVYCAPSDGGRTDENALLMAALHGNLGRLKDIVNSLTRGNGGPSAIFSFNKDGVDVLHGAACGGHLEVCKYLVEELGGDVNAPGIGSVALGATPFMMSAQSGDVPTVKYFLDHGGDLMKADDKGRTILHHAVSAG